MRLKRRIWIEDFRIYDDTQGRMVNSMMQQWKASRQRPTHFVRAILLYKALLDGDVSYFMQLLIDFAPRMAMKMMQQFGGGSNEPPAPAPERIQKYDDYDVEYSEAPASEKIDALAGSLGLDELSFD